jgi:hypothetical protein
MQSALMPFIRHVLCTLLALQVAGCNTETVKRTTYETLQNIHQQECLKNPSLDCEERDAYDTYTKKRQEVDPAQ